MSAGVLTFSNLFPSAVMPTHGLFVQQRMQRVAAAGGFAWQVVAPVPQVAWLLRAGHWRRWAAVPAQETVDGTTVHHPRYRHWPGLSLRGQADSMASGALPVVQQVCAGGRWLLDAHYLWPDGVAAATIAQQLGLPYALTARGSDLNVIANDHAIAARIAAAAQGAVLCAGVSRALCARFAALTGLDRTRIVEVRNGVDLERFRLGDAAAARQALGLPARGTLLLGVGRLVPGKGFDLAARALRALPADVSLVLVGDGSERSRLGELGAGRVHCLGAQPPAMVALAYQACDLLVLPSEREGWPNVVTEALASGLRVVASAVGGIPEILGEPPPADGWLGALVPPRDQAALTAALQRVLAQPGDRARVRAFAQRYGWAEPVALLVAAFRTALAGAPA